MRPSPPVARTRSPLQPSLPVVQTRSPLRPSLPVAQTRSPLQPSPPVVLTRSPLQPSLSVLPTRSPLRPSPPVVLTRSPLQPSLSVLPTRSPLRPSPPVVLTRSPLQPSPPQTRSSLPGPVSSCQSLFALKTVDRDICKTLKRPRCKETRGKGKMMHSNHYFIFMHSWESQNITTGQTKTCSLQAIQTEFR